LSAVTGLCRSYGWLGSGKKKRARLSGRARVGLLRFCAFFRAGRERVKRARKKKTIIQSPRHKGLGGSGGSRRKGPPVCRIVLTGTVRGKASRPRKKEKTSGDVPVGRKRQKSCDEGRARKCRGTEQVRRLHQFSQAKHKKDGKRRESGN